MKGFLLFLFIAPFSFYAQSNTFPASGNVGIGTTSPTHKLHISGGGALIKKTAIGLTAYSAENSWIRDEWVTGNYGPPQWDQSKKRWVRPSGTYNDIGGIIWQDEGTYFIRDKAGTKLEYTNEELLNTAFLFASIYGNIGIGTTSLSNWKLAVNGKIRAKEIKVETGWSDFVFEGTYNLPTLEEVEQHIKEKGHLKDIPSAKEVEENGVFLGEINAKLLQKIEELTLYTIQQQKEIEALREEVHALKKNN